MCFSFWGFSRGDSRLTNQSATWLIYLKGVSIFPGKTPKAKTHSVKTQLNKKYPFIGLWPILARFSTKLKKSAF